MSEVAASLFPLMIFSFGLVMKNLWIWIVLSIGIGTATAWAINYQRFGHRVARMGPFASDSDFTVDQIPSLLEEVDTREVSKVELVGSELHDFGMMAPGAKGEHSYVVKNVGDADLTLRLGASTCKCTFGELSSDKLAPGAETEITLSWEVKTGKNTFNQSAQVITNDPERPVLNFRISGKVALEAEVVPETWTFGEVASGDPIELAGTIYNFSDADFKVKELEFSNKAMTDLAEFDVEEFKPTKEDDGERSIARQGFRISINMKPGLRQGSISQNFIFRFQKIDDDGNIIKFENDDNEDDSFAIAVATQGRVVGPLGMITNNKLESLESGGYLYNFGKIAPDGDLTASTFVVLKGSERDNTNLSIGATSPDGVVKATLGEPKGGRGSMLLIPLEIELVPGEESIERLGKNKDDYGMIWIESDNPKVSKLRLALKFAIEGR
jgi:hypothetical protein